VAKKKKIPAVVVEESSEYENFMDKLGSEGKDPENPLAELLGVADQPRHIWEKYWVGMPEFQQEENPPFKRLVISFRTEDDYKEFAKVIGQNLTDKSKSIWYPKLEIEDNSLCRWIDEQDNWDTLNDA